MALVDYVKKVEGKGLSTNDFTNELKTKLEGITPYDPSELEAEIEKLETALNTLVGSNASNAIESFNEIIAFLDGISDSEDLDSIIASIERQVASKYSKPLSGIPKADLSSDVQSSLNKAESALQKEQFKGTITAVDTDESVDDPDIPSGSYDDTEIKAQIKENADNIAVNKADADAKLSELGSKMEVSIRDSLVVTSGGDSFKAKLGDNYFYVFSSEFASQYSNEEVSANASSLSGYAAVYLDLNERPTKINYPWNLKVRSFSEYFGEASKNSVLVALLDTWGRGIVYSICHSVIWNGVTYKNYTSTNFIKEIESQKKSIYNLESNVGFKKNEVKFSIGNGWNNQRVNLIVGEEFTIDITGAEVGSMFYVYTVKQDNLSAIIETVSQRTAQDSDFVIKFTPNKEADTLRIYNGSSLIVNLSYYIACEGDKELYREILNNQEKIKSVDSKIENIYLDYETEGTLLNGWTHINENIEPGKKYIFSLSKAESGKTFHIYTFSSETSSIVEKVVETTLKDGNFTTPFFTATKKADTLRVFYNGEEALLTAYIFNINTLGENSKLAKANKRAIDGIKELSQPYKGLKILSLGDSFTWHNFYGGYLAEITGCEQRGRGRNGASFRYFAGDVYTGPNGEEISEQFDSALLSSYDIITIMGGTNNYGKGQPIGTLDDDETMSTVFGELRYLLNKILSIDANKKIYFCTQPYRCPNPAFHGGIGGYQPNAGGATMEDVANAVVKFAEHYGYPCYDFYHESGWNEYNNKVTNEGAEGTYLPFDGNKYTSDGLHPRSGKGNGAYQLGRNFGEYINRHFLL